MSDQPTADKHIPSVPSSWPGAFGAYKHSRKAVRTNLNTVISIWVALLIVDVITQIILKDASSIASFIVNALAGAMFALVYIAGVREQRLSFKQALDKAVPLWIKMLLLSILIVLSVVGSLLLLIVPFFFVFPRLTLASYFLVDKDLGVVGAYKASWEATRGHVRKIWGVIIAFILMALLAITIIGIPFAIYFVFMYGAAYAVLYEFLLKSKPRTAKAKG